MQEDLFRDNAKYIFDSSCIISLRQFYPKDIFAPLHTKLADILQAGRIATLDMILSELKDKEPELHKFFSGQIPKDRQFAFASYVDITQRIILNYYDNHGQSHNLKADPHVIGCAKAEKLAVVTDELNSGITSIPYVCHKEAVK